MADPLDPGGLTEWWDVPADYFDSGGFDFGGGFGDYGIGDAGWGSPGGASGGQFYWDTQTGQIVDAAFVAGNGGFSTVVGGSSTGAPGGVTPGAGGGGTCGGGGAGGFTARDLIGFLTAAGGLTAAGMGIASLFTGSDPANRTTTQTTQTGQTGGMSPDMQRLLQGGGGAGGAGGVGAGGGMLYDTQTGQYLTADAARTLDAPGFASYTTAFGSGTGLMGLAGGAAESVGGPGGLMNQQQQILGALPSNIPQLNPAIMQALGANALGMSQGMLPALADPNIQARIASVYQPGFDALNYTAGQQLDQAREQLMQRGFAAPDIREGPTQALTAPIMAAQQLGRSQLYGQMAGSQLDLASRLPMQGSQLAAQQYALASQPFGLGLAAAGAFNQPIATQAQLPLSLFDILQRGQGTTQTINSVGPQPSLTTQLGQIAPIIGMGGNLLSSAGNMLYPPQQNQAGSSFNPYTGGSLYGG